MEQMKWHEYLLPVLKSLEDKSTKKRHPLIDDVANLLGLSAEIKNELTSSGEPIYANRIGWAITYLKQSGLLESPKRAEFRITNLGLEFLAKNPSTMSEDDLVVYPGYQEFINRTKKNVIKEESESKTNDSLSTSLTAEELLEQAQKEIKEVTCAELLESAKKVSPSAFENLVIDLLKKMGYGDINDPLSGIRIGGAGDGGIDGIINQDKLGLDRIYVQAKRYKETNTVGPNIVREFIGSLSIKGANKGIIITTSSFTEQAKKHADECKPQTIILIDGKRLAELMHDYDVGVTNKHTILIKKIDSDYFEY